MLLCSFPASSTYSGATVETGALTLSRPAVLHRLLAHISVDCISAVSICMIITPPFSLPECNCAWCILLRGLTDDGITAFLANNLQPS